MNHKRREILKHAKEHLCTATVMISRALDEEEDCHDNVPENLADSDRYEKMEHAIDAMSDSVELIDEAIDRINEAIL